VDGVQLAYSYDVCPDNGRSGEFSGLMDMCPWPYNGTSLPCTESEKVRQVAPARAPLSGKSCARSPCFCQGAKDQQIMAESR